MRHLPAAIVILNTMVLITRSGLGGDSRLFARALGYFLTSAFILILFWSEAVGRFGRGAALDATRVGSYAALQDPGARVLTAQDTGLVPSPLQGSAVLPPGLRLLLRAFTETPLALARVFNTAAHRPFSAVVPMQWLLTYPLAGEAEAAVRDFVHGCFLPAKTRLLPTHTGAPLTFQDLLVAAHLAKGVPPEFWAVPGQWTEQLSAELVVTVVGILLVPVVLGTLIVGSWRAIGGLWRGVP